jgi:hypothetical protein
MPEREYLDLDIPVHMKQSGLPRGKTAHQIHLSGMMALRDPVNNVIRAYVERYRAQGWQPEGGIDLLAIFRNHRVSFHRSLFGKVVVDSVRVTFHRDKK